MTEFNISQYPDATRVSDELISTRIARFHKNFIGRDFVVGDVNGMFGYLRKLLEGVDFDPRRDRLFSVGDLVDRGPNSAQALDWLHQSWFFACGGNHEQFALVSDDPEQLELWMNHKDGGWWLDINDKDRLVYRKAFADMPLAIELETNSGVV